MNAPTLNTPDAVRQLLDDDRLDELRHNLEASMAGLAPALPDAVWRAAFNERPKLTARTIFDTVFPIYEKPAEKASLRHLPPTILLEFEPTLLRELQRKAKEIQLAEEDATGTVKARTAAVLKAREHSFKDALLVAAIEYLPAQVTLQRFKYADVCDYMRKRYPQGLPPALAKKLQSIAVERVQQARARMQAERNQVSTKTTPVR